jgi:hypothetical protein
MGSWGVFFHEPLHLLRNFCAFKPPPEIVTATCQKKKHIEPVFDNKAIEVPHDDQLDDRPCEIQDPCDAKK